MPKYPDFEAFDDVGEDLGLHNGLGGLGVTHLCNAGDPGSIPRLGRSAGEGIAYPLQYSQASFVA